LTRAKINHLRAMTNQVRYTARRDPANWAATAGVTLRPYQVEISQAIKDSIIHNRGLTFVVILPRQSGKNELQSHIFSWLMFRYKDAGGRIVSVSPTFKPQTVNSMDRVRTSLEKNILTRGKWRPSSGFIYRYFSSRLQFFSADPSANVVGATADLLLSIDEAQDVDPVKFSKDFDPMTASTNATRGFWGTVWTTNTLLHQQRIIAEQQQRADGIKRLFIYDADDIRKLVPPYGEHVDRVISEKGRQHPLVKTQYFCEEIDAQSGMFNAGRLALMQGDQPAQDNPIPGHVYAFCIDVAGMDEALLNLDGMGNPGRDSTTLSIVDVDLSQLQTLQAPIYRIVHRATWQGINHLKIFGQLTTYASRYHPQYVVIDATGVGEGLWTLLDNALPDRVIPVKFSQQKKSEIGYAFLGIIETGRLRDCSMIDDVIIQYRHCQSEILPGPQHTMRWGVPDGRRGPGGELLHDDYILADALTAELDNLEWIPHIETGVIHGTDPLSEMDRNF